MVTRQRSLGLNRRGLGKLRSRVRLLSGALRARDGLRRGLCRLLGADSGIHLDGGISITTLRTVPLSTLAALINSLRGSLRGISQFMSSRRRRLALRQRTVRRVGTGVRRTGRFRHLRVRARLIRRRSHCRVLGRALIKRHHGLLRQRRVLDRRRTILQQQRNLTIRRAPIGTISLRPLLGAISSRQRRAISRVRTLRTRTGRARRALGRLGTRLTAGSDSLTTQQTRVRGFRARLRRRRVSLTTVGNGLTIYRRLLGPARSDAGNLQRSLRTLTKKITGIRRVGSSRLRTVTRLHRAIVGIISKSGRRITTSWRLP